MVFIVPWKMIIAFLKIKNPTRKLIGFKEYGSYLLSRIVVQYHWP